MSYPLPSDYYDYAEPYSEPPRKPKAPRLVWVAHGKHYYTKLMLAEDLKEDGTCQIDGHAAQWFPFSS